MKPYNLAAAIANEMPPSMVLRKIVIGALCGINLTELILGFEEKFMGCQRYPAALI